MRPVLRPAGAQQVGVRTAARALESASKYEETDYGGDDSGIRLQGFKVSRFQKMVRNRLNVENLKSLNRCNFLLIYVFAHRT